MYDLFLKLADISINPNSLSGIPKGSPDNVISNVLKIVFALAAAIAVLIIVIAGLRMTTSSGNPDAVNRARNTIVFAAIGLIVCLGGFVIVTFVLKNI